MPRGVAEGSRRELQGRRRRPGKACTEAASIAYRPRTTRDSLREADRSHLSVFGSHGVRIASMAERRVHQVMLVEGGRQRRRGRGQGRPIPNELPSVSRAATIAMATKTRWPGGKCGPLQAPDASKRPPIAASAKEETSGNLADFVIASPRPQPEHACCAVHFVWRVSWQSRSRARTSHLGDAVVTPAVAGERVGMFKPCSQQTVIGGERSEQPVRHYCSTRCACTLTAQVPIADYRLESDPPPAGQRIRQPDTSA